MPHRRLPTSFTAGRTIGLGERSAVLATPVLVKGTTNATGGTFTAGSVYWVLTAVNAIGETVASNEVTATVLATSSQDLSWAAVTGATGYKLYRGTTSGSYTKRVVALGAVTSYTDLGNPGTAASPPLVDTARSEIIYQLGDAIPKATVKAIKHVSALLSRKWIIPNADPNYRKTRSTTPTPIDLGPPVVRKAI